MDDTRKGVKILGKNKQKQQQTDKIVPQEKWYRNIYIQLHSLTHTPVFIQIED